MSASNLRPSHCESNALPTVLAVPVSSINFLIKIIHDNGLQ